MKMQAVYSSCDGRALRRLLQSSSQIKKNSAHFINFSLECRLRHQSNCIFVLLLTFLFKSKRNSIELQKKELSYFLIQFPFLNSFLPWIVSAAKFSSLSKKLKYFGNYLNWLHFPKSKKKIWGKTVCTLSNDLQDVIAVNWVSYLTEIFIQGCVPSWISLLSISDPT